MDHTYGVYGIWFEDELVYIGKTDANGTFQKCFQNQGGYLLENIEIAKKAGKVEAKPILSFDREVEKMFCDRDLACMAFALDKTLKPRLNREGVFTF